MGNFNLRIYIKAIPFHIFVKSYFYTSTPEFRVSSERNVSRKNAKMFCRISQTFSRNFPFYRKNKWSEISRKCENNFAKCENFVKTMCFITSTVIAQKNFSALSWNCRAVDIEINAWSSLFLNIETNLILC